MAAMGGLGNFPPMTMPPSMGNNMGMMTNTMSNMSTMPPNMMQQNKGSNGPVTLRVLISREEGQFLFGNDEALLGMLREGFNKIFLVN